MSLSEPMKAGMLVKVKGLGGIGTLGDNHHAVRGHSPETSGLLTQLKRQGTITLAALVYISFQQVQGS